MGPSGKLTIQKPTSANHSKVFEVCSIDAIVAFVFCTILHQTKGYSQRPEMPLQRRIIKLSDPNSSPYLQNDRDVLQ